MLTSLNNEKINATDARAVVCEGDSCLKVETCKPLRRMGDSPRGYGFRNEGLFIGGCASSCSHVLGSSWYYRYCGSHVGTRRHAGPARRKQLEVPSGSELGGRAAPDSYLGRVRRMQVESTVGFAAKTLTINVNIHIHSKYSPFDTLDRRAWDMCVSPFF